MLITGKVIHACGQGKYGKSEKNIFNYLNVQVEHYYDNGQIT